MSAAGRALWAALDRHEDWSVGAHTATHVPSGTVFWHVNGALFFDGYESWKGALGLIERHWLFRKFRRMRSAKVAAALTAVGGEGQG